MQFNRNEYLVGNFDHESVEEKTNAYNAYHLKGMEWNNYIKDYVKNCLGNAIGTFNYPWQLVQPFANLGPFIDLGLFIQAADYLESLESENESFNENKALWVERLRTADDLVYQATNNPDYESFTIKEMKKNGTIEKLSKVGSLEQLKNLNKENSKE